MQFGTSSMRAGAPMGGAQGVPGALDRSNHSVLNP